MNFVRAFVALLAAGAVAAGSSAEAGAQTAPLSIDVFLPVTGQAAFSGQALSQAAAAFEKYANAHGGVRGQPIHFDISDDQTSPQVALQLTNAAIARHVPVILGSAVVATCASIGAAVAATGPVQFCFSPGYSPPKDSYSFASSITIINATKAILTYAKLRGFHRIAFLGSTDATGIASAAANAELFKSPDLRGIELVADERIANTDVTATAQMSKIKATRPDVLWTSTTGTVFSTAMHGMNDVGLAVPVITTTANASVPQLKSLSDVLPHDVYFNGFSYQLGDLLRDNEVREQGKIFADAFKQIGVAPTALHALAWDEMLLVLAGYRQYGPAMTADQLKAFTLGQHRFPGLNGNYDFTSGDQHGLTSDAVVVIGWDKDKQDFYPASQPGGVPIKR